MQLAACPGCHAQYDVTGRSGDSLSCPCGATFAVGTPRAVDAEVRRCASCGALLFSAAASCEYCGGRVTREGEKSLICPECYARNLPESFFCTACGVRFQPQPFPEPDEGVICVRCAEGTEPHRIAGLTVHECGLCHGLWVPGSGFETLVNRAIESWKESAPGLAPASPRRSGGSPTSSGVEYRKCPVCATLMDRRNYLRTSGVVIDRCTAHGTWLDADELERIAGFILTGGVEKARAAEQTTMKVPDRANPSPTRASADFERILQESRSTASDGQPVDTIMKLLARLVGRLL